MKKLLAITLFTFSMAFSTFAQESSPMREFNQFLAKNLKYDSELRHERIQGPVTVSLNINEKGELKNQPELVGGNEDLAQEVYLSIEKMEAEGISKFIEPEFFGKEVLVSVEFKLSESNRTGFYVPNTPENENKELEKLNIAIDENPYFAPNYIKRAEFYEHMGKKVQAQLDTEYAELLKEKNISTIVVVGYISNDIQRKLKSE